MTQAHPLTHPIPWIRRIAKEIAALDAVPLFGHAPPFDWEKLSSLLSASFGVQGLSIAPRSQKWGSGEELGEGLGVNPLIIPITVSPLPTPLFFAISQADRRKLTGLLLNGTEDSFSSELLQEGYYRFLLLQTLDAAQSLDLLKEMTLQLGEDASLPSDKAFCIDISLSFGGRSCWSRLIITPEFRKNWVEHFSAFPSDYFPTPLSKKLEVPLGLKAGSILLSQKEWKKVREGDFLLLDQASFDPFNRTGSVMLTLRSRPLFEAKINQNKVQLTGYALIQEEPMQEPKKPPATHSLEAVEEEAMAVKDLPLHLSVELSRVKMTLDQLMSLSPGNVLELPVLPEENVSLTVDGQKVGRGELIYLGEMLGVRILEMG